MASDALQSLKFVDADGNDDDEDEEDEAADDDQTDLNARHPEDLPTLSLVP